MKKTKIIKIKNLEPKKELEYEVDENFVPLLKMIAKWLNYLTNSKVEVKDD